MAEGEPALPFIVGAVVGLCSMLDDAGVPHVGGAQLLDGFQCLGGEVGQLAAAILPDAAVMNTLCIVVAKEAGENLIKDDFLHDLMSTVNGQRSTDDCRSGCLLMIL